MKQSLVIVKVGGKIVEEPETLGKLLDDFNSIPGNKLLVHGGGRSATALAEMQARGMNAIGLSGADCNVMLSDKRPVKDIDYGFVGDVRSVNAVFLASLIEQGIIPVLAPLTHDGRGQLLNTNADTIAGEAAKALASAFRVTLIYCFEKPGVLMDENDDNSVIPYLSYYDFPRLVQDGTISGGMIPKIQNAFEALQAGVSSVLITKAGNLDRLTGTTIAL